MSAILASDLVGMTASHLLETWRRFGAVGPVYEIIAAGQILPDGDRLMRIRVVESGEEVDYRLT